VPGIYTDVVLIGLNFIDIQFVELAGDSGCSELHAYRKNGKTESFAWMAIPGVYYGNIDHTASSGEPLSYIVLQTLLVLMLYTYIE